jgi:hypothetical protein
VGQGYHLAGLCKLVLRVAVGGGGEGGREGGEVEEMGREGEEGRRQKKGI